MLLYWLWLSRKTEVKDGVKKSLLQHFGHPEDLFYAEKEKIQQADIQGLTENVLEALCDKDLSQAEECLAQCARLDIKILTMEDKAYPNRLREIFDPPVVLYYKGTIPNWDEVPVVAVVGTRRSSLYGNQTAGRFGREIAQSGGLLVSGLADGIDGCAMAGALDAGYPVVGVLGCGVDIIYPKRNRELFAQTERLGCILSEFIPGTPPLKQNFPRRNRIISGLSCGVVVVEAPERSGALSTARQALSQNRDVFAVPGNVDLPTFAGSNRLLKEGAGSVTCGWDILSEYLPLFPDKIRRAEAPRRIGDFPAPAPAPSQRKQVKTPQIPKKDIDNPAATPYIDRKTPLPALSEEEKRIVSALGSTEKRVDDLIAETGIPSGTLLRSLTMLELKQVILRLPGNRVVRK